jgi:hypothetical protein
MNDRAERRGEEKREDNMAANRICIHSHTISDGIPGQPTTKTSDPRGYIFFERGKFRDLRAGWRF